MLDGVNYRVGLKLSGILTAVERKDIIKEFKAFLISILNFTIL